MKQANFDRLNVHIEESGMLHLQMYTHADLCNFKQHIVQTECEREKDVLSTKLPSEITIGT